MPQCKGLNRLGGRCRNEAVPGGSYCHIASHANSASTWPRRSAEFLQSHPIVTGIAFIAALVTLVGFCKQIVDARHSATSGVLSPIDSSPAKYLSIGGVKFEEENPQGIFMKDGDDPILSVRESYARSGQCLWLWPCVKQILVSVKLKNAKGELIAEIRNNEWTLQPKPQIFDRNYTNSILEVRDANTGRVALQVVDLGESIHLSGAFICSHTGWTFTFGPAQDGSGIIEVRPPGAPVHFLIPPVCQYPSELHFGQCSSGPIRSQLTSTQAAYPVRTPIQICKDLAAEENRKSAAQ